MSQSIQLQVTQVGLEQSIAAAMKRVGSSSQINLGTSSKQINALSQPLGRITGQADEFSKSMAAANARVLAFGASAGIIAGVSKAMSGLLTSTIKVEKSLVEISTVLNKTGSELDKFGQDIFNVAKNTGKSFDEVSKGALELARQGLNAEDTLARLNDALILSRLSGLDAAQSVEGLTAAFNSFKSSGITTAEILNKVVAVSQEYAVSERDIIEGLKRSASVANLAGVSFEELAAVITAVQEKTARGGAVIGNAFKTIFSRIQDKAVLSDLQDMGVGVTDLQGEVLPALKILESLAKKMEGFSQIEQADIAKKLGGVYQLDKLLAALSDLSDEASVTTGALEAMGEAGSKAYQKNAVLNQTLAALLNKVAVSAEQLGAKLGEIGVTDSLKNVLGFFNGLLEGIQKVLGEESGLGDLVRGLVKGLGAFLAGPGLALFGAIILKLSKDLVQFGFASLKAFFGIGKAAKEVQNVEGSISQILAKNVNLQQQLFALEGNRAAQLRLITGALVEQEALLRRSANISSGLGAPLYNAGVRARESGLRIGNSAGGYMPAVAKESKAIKQGVGGARAGDKPVVMPNFNFGGGKKGSIVAHTGEYVVPNFGGGSGSAIFNRSMVQKMGLPSGAKKINAAGGLVPSPSVPASVRGYSLSSFAGVRIDNPRARTQFGKNKNENIEPDDKISTVGFGIEKIPIPKELEIALKENKKYLGKKATDAFELIAIEHFKKKGIQFKLGSEKLSYETSSSVDGYDFNSIANKEISLLEVKSGEWSPLDVGNKFGRFLPENVANDRISSEINPYFTEGIKGKQDLINLKNTLAVPDTERGRSFIRKDKNKNEILSYSGFKTKSIATSVRNKAKKKQIENAVNAASGFIPNFAEAPRRIATSDEIRKYVEDGTIQNYIRPGKDEFGRPYRTYWFPENAQAAPSQVEKVMKSSRAIGAVRKDAKEAKMAEKGVYQIDANALGGIALISPRFGKQQGILDTSMKIADIPFFNQEKSPPINKESYIKLLGIQKTNTPSGTDVKGLEKDVSSIFAPSIVNLAYKLYGKLFSQKEEWVDIMNRIPDTEGQQLLPPAAQGDLFEAASKVALNSLSDALKTNKKTNTSYLNPKGIFSSSEQNRPFDFSNQKAIFDIFGVNAKRGEAKRGGETNFESSGQVQGLIKKVFNDSEYGKEAVNILKGQGAFNLSKAEKAAQAKNAFGGFIPNFANPLQDAVNREMSAGIPASQIYVDKSPSLKNAANPMGLMVANRRDEPAGGFQGINRAIKEGADPKSYGAASGFIPNFAPKAKNSGIDLSKFILGGAGPNIFTTSPYDVLKADGELSGGLAYALKYPDRSYAATASANGVKVLQSLYDEAIKSGGKLYYAPHAPITSLAKYGTKTGGMNKRNIFFLQDVMRQNKGLFKSGLEKKILSIDPKNATLKETGDLYDEARLSLQAKGIRAKDITLAFRKAIQRLADPTILEYAKTNKTGSISYIAAEVDADETGSVRAKDSKHPLYPQAALAKKGGALQFNPFDPKAQIEAVTGVKQQKQPAPSFLPYGMRFEKGDDLSKLLGLAAGGFIPNFNNYKLLKQGKDSNLEILDKVSGSYLQYSKNDDNLEIKTAFSYQKGSMLGLYNNLGEIAKKSGKKLFSRTILPQTDRLKSFDENSSIDEILKAVYPQLAYREKSNSKNTKLKLYLGGYDTDLSGKNIFQQVANYFKNTSPTSPKDLLSSIENRRLSIARVEDTFADGYIPNAAGGFVPNFPYQLKKSPKSDIRSIVNTENKSELNYAPGESAKRGRYLDMVGVHSEKPGQGLELFKRLGKIARRSGRKVYSSSLIPQDNRLKLLNQDSSINEILKLIYPQLSYRQKSGTKNTKLDFEFDQIEKELSGANIFDLVANEFKNVESGELIKAIQNKKVGFSSIIDTFAGGFVPNFGVMDAFQAAKFAMSASKNLGSQLPKGVISSALKGKLDLDKVWPMVSKFVEEPERLIKTRKDLDNAKYTIKTFLTNDKLREKFAKFAAQRINTSFYNNKNVISGTRESGGGEGHSVDADSEQYLIYRLLGGQKSLKDYDGKKTDAYFQKGEFLKLNPKSEHAMEVAREAALASRRGFSADHEQNKARMIDDKAGFYGNTALFGGFTGKQKLVMRKNEFPQAYASYKDLWDVALHPAEKEILYKYLDGQLKPSASEFSKIIKSQNAYVESERSGFNIGPYILRELVSSIPKAKPAVFKGVVPFNTRAAGGFIPNFAGGSDIIKKIKEAAVSNKGGLGYLLKTLVSEIMFDGFVSPEEIDKIKEVTKFFLQRDLKGKNKRKLDKALKDDPEAKRQLEELKRIMGGGSGNAAGGFLPNFANPLQEAVGREMAAGVPASQIYIDKSPALKNAANPMGLMVANRRDEPAGGFQGISRARREGANPMMYGAAGGFVPNYAISPDPQIGSVKDKKGNLDGPSVDQVNAELKRLAQKMKDEGASLDEAIKAIEEFIRVHVLDKKTQDKVNKITPKLLESYDKELKLQQEEIAQQTLSLKGNKKLASQLDKIYQEYNKSAKTTQDLENAKKKATSILNQQKLPFTAQTKTAIVASTGSLAATRTSAQPGAGAGGNRDMLGTIFAIQGAMTALAGATDGATSGFGFFANTLGDAASTASTVAFGFSGIGQMLPQFSKQLGVAGLAIGAATLAYKIGTTYYNKMSGITSAVASSVEMMGKAAEGAAISLNTIGATRKEEIQKRAKKLSGNLEYGTVKNEKFASPTGGGTVKYRDKAKFQGSIGGVLNNDLRDQYNKVFESALAQQVPENVLKAAADKIKNDGFITAGEIKSFSAEIADAMEKASKEVNNFLNSIKDNPTISDNLAKMKNQDFAELLDTNVIQGDEARAEAAGYTSVDEYKNNYRGYKGKDLKTRVMETLGMTSNEYDKRFKDMTEPQVGDVLTAARTRSKATLTEKEGAINQSPIQLKNAIKAAQREKIEREAIRGIDQQIENARYNSALETAGIEADLTLSASQRAQLNLDIQNRLENQTAEYEKQKTVVEKINNLAAGIEGNILFTGIDKTDQIAAAKKVLDNLKDSGEAKGLLTLRSGTQQDEAAKKLIQDQLASMKDDEGAGKIEAASGAVSELATMLIALATTSDAATRSVEDGNAVRQKNTELQKTQNAVQEQNSRLIEKIQGRLSAVADNYSLDATALGRRSQMLAAERGVSLAQYNATTQETDPDKIFEAQQRINDAFFKKILDANQAQSISDAKAEFVRSQKVDQNINSLLANNTATDSNTKAINELKDEFVRMKNVGENPTTVSGAMDLKNIKENGANVMMLNKDLADNIQKFAKAYKTRTGKDLEIMGPRSGVRTLQEQFDIRNEAIRKNGMEYAMKYTATPGKSLHGKGLALDINQQQIAEAEDLGIKLSDYGLTRPMSYEPWHVETTNARSRIESTGVTSEKAFNRSMISTNDQMKLAEGIAKQYQKPTEIRSAAEEAVNKLNLNPENAEAATEAIKNLAMRINEVGANRAFEEKQEELKKLEEQANRTRRSLAYQEKGSLDEKLKTPASTFTEGMRNGFLQLEADSQDFAYILGKDIPKMFSDGMSGAINSAIEGTSSLKDALRSAAYEFVKGINQRLMSNLMDKIVYGSGKAAMETGGTGGGGIMSFFSNMFAAGGKVTGGSGSKDDVPAMLMGGEYVVNKRAVAKYGPQFLEAINNGTLAGYAKGGKIQRGPQGNFYTPGTFGQGAIEGKMNLLDFATQTGTSGKFDQMINESDYQSIALEPESSRLSVSGMRNSPMFEATQSAKGQAFDLYLQQYNAEREAKKQAKEQKKALIKQIGMLALSAALGPVINAAGSGFSAAFKGADGQGFMSQVGAGFKGIAYGGNIGGQQVGGLSNLFSSVGKTFSGDFAGAANKFKMSQIGNSSKLLDLYQSDPKFASYINSIGGFNGPVMGRATAVSNRAIGGMIPSMSGIDTVPAMLSGGEFVMNRSAVQSIGAPNLQSMNSGGTSITSEETSKELNEKLLAKLDELIGTSGSTGNITINVAPSGQTSQETSQDPSASRQQLARQIKDAVLQIINDEKRIGGSLRR